MKKFKIKDYVVYPSHGIGQIIDIKEKDIGIKQSYYIVKMLNSNMKVMIPEINNVSLRNLMSKEKLKQCEAILKSKPSKLVKKNWNKKYRFYMDCLQTGDSVKIAHVIASIKNNKLDDDLSFGEKKIIDKAEELLYTEIKLIKKGVL